MGAYVVLRDQTITGRIVQELELALDSELTTVGALIAARVRIELALRNQQLSERLRGAELLGGRPGPQGCPPIDADMHVAAWLEAFKHSAYLVLIDDEQCDDPDQEVLITPSTSVSFLNLPTLSGAP